MSTLRNSKESEVSPEWRHPSIQRRISQRVSNILDNPITLTLVWASLAGISYMREWSDSFGIVVGILFSIAGMMGYPLQRKDEIPDASED